MVVMFEDVAHRCTPVEVVPRGLNVCDSTTCGSGNKDEGPLSNALAVGMVTRFVDGSPNGKQHELGDPKAHAQWKAHSPGSEGPGLHDIGINLTRGHAQRRWRDGVASMSRTTATRLAKAPFKTRSAYTPVDEIDPDLVSHRHVRMCHRCQLVPPHPVT